LQYLFDRHVCAIASIASSALKSIHRTLPSEDTLLAAQCLAKGHTLVTDIAKHFELLRPLGWVVDNPLV